MNEKDLCDFVQNNPESQTIEYKLKPNFNDIKKTIEHIKDRMHFNILKTIYAFANTDGGALFIGIKEIKNNRANKSNWDIVGVDDSDLGIIISILKKINPQITTQKNIIELKEQKRNVIKITVQPLKIYDRPQLLNGILYYRENDNTTQLKSFESGPKIYQKEQFYLFLIKGMRSHFQKWTHTTSEEKTTSAENLELDLFIEGLKSYIKEITINSEITSRNSIEESYQLLDKIKKGLTDIIDEKHNIGSAKRDTLPTNVSHDIDGFIQIYKQIIVENRS